MPDIHEQYEAELRKRMAAINKRIKKTYEKGIGEIQVTLSTVKYKGIPFALKDYPSLQKKIDTVSKQMHSSIYATTVNSIKDSWDLSNKKNNVIADKRLSGSRVPKDARSVIYDPNKGALEAFMKRKEKGLNLSDRIWNTLDPFKKEMEQTIGIGIGAGKPAREIAKDAKKYLNEPDKLFRRVRGEDGKLYLSATARNYHPGQGVYRSSFKNAMRVARTETNDSYRSSDYERWKNMEFITGIEVKLSNAHPRYDICDQVKGKYPKDFKFRGWHPQCLCYAVPNIMSDDEFEKLEDQVLAGEPVGIESKDAITKPPKGFTDYVANNKDRINGWKNKPYWMEDNKQYLTVKAIGDVGKISVKNLKSLGFEVTAGESELNRVLKGFDFDKFDSKMQQIGNRYGVAFTKKLVESIDDSVVFIYRGNNFNLVRKFSINSNAVKEVDHVLFTMPKYLQGGGMSKDIFQALYEQYISAGIKKINVHANIDVGGYAWARYGFSSNNKDEIIDVIKEAPKKLADAEYADFQSWLEKGQKNKFYPMWELANRAYGKKLLLNSDWYGFVDLDNPIQRNVFEDYLFNRK